MGCFPKSSSVSTEAKPVSAPRPTGNPNPHKFTIQSSEKIGDLFLATIVYPDCKNFEGCKVLVMNKDPKTMEVIDPHFTSGGYVVARFAPTVVGKNQARKFMEYMERGSLT